MKSFGCLLFFAMICLSAVAQYPSTCEVPPVLQSHYDLDVKHLALKRIFDLNSTYKDTVEIPASFQDTIWQGLSAIFRITPLEERDSVFDLYCIHHFNSNYLYHSILVMVNPAFGWTQNWKNLITTTGIPQLDSLLSKYGFTVTDYSVFGNFATLSTQQRINIFPVIAKLKTFPGILYAEANGLYGAGNTIVYNKAGNDRFFDFTIGYDDCFAGCISKHIYKFKVLQDCSVVFLGVVDIFGPTIYFPSPGNCNITGNLPFPTLSGEDTICDGSLVQNYYTEPGMTNYTWTFTGGTVVSGGGVYDDHVTVNWDGQPPYTLKITYNMADVTAISVIKTQELPVSVSIVSSADMVCGGTSVTYTSSHINGGTPDYQWRVNGVNAGTNSPTFSYIPLPGDAVDLMIYSSLECAQGNPAISNTLAVVVNESPNPSVTGEDELCLNSGYFYYSTEAGMTGYQWSIQGGTILEGAGTDHVLVHWENPGPQWLQVSYTNLAGCTAPEPTQFNVDVEPFPGQAGVISGSETVCAGESSLAYSIAPVVDAMTYVWDLPDGVEIVSGSGTNSILVNCSREALSGIITVYGNNLCGNGASSPDFNLTINPVPPEPVISEINDTLFSSASSGNQWYFEIQPIPGATENYLVPQENGEYFADVTQNGCRSDTSLHYHFIVSGDENLKNTRWDLYPNPGDGMVCLKGNPRSSGNLDIEIVNDLGVKIYERKIQHTAGPFQADLDLTGLGNGIYFCILTDPFGTFLKKLMIRK